MSKGDKIHPDGDGVPDMETDGVACDEPKVGVDDDVDFDIDDVFDVTLDVQLSMLLLMLILMLMLMLKIENDVVQN